MDTNTQIERLIELAIVQRTELKRLVEELPQLKEHLSAEIERTFEETEPQLRAELEEWTSKQAADKTAALGLALESKIASLAKSLEESAQAKFSAVLAARDQNADLLKQAEERIAVAASEIPGKVKEIVTAELARFPRAGEIDRLRKEFQEPRGLNPRGKWLPDQTYNKLDLVTWNGDSYVSNTDGNKERPGRNAANWTLSAARGTSGGGPADLSALTAVPSNGTLLIGSGTSWVNGQLTAGAGVSITVGPGAITISATDGDITLDDGTAASPSLHFTNDPDTGIYRPAANTLGISVSGTQVAYFDANGITTVGAGATFDGSVHAANGNANNPSLSFTSDQDTGFFRHQPNEIGVALGGTQKATLTSTTFTITPNLVVSGTGSINGTTIPASKTLVVTTDKLSALASTSSSELAGVISDETGTGALVFANTPTLTTPNIGAATGTSFNLTGSGTLGTTLTVNGTTDSSSKDTGAIVTEGGLGVEKSATIGGNLTVSGTGPHTFSGRLNITNTSGNVSLVQGAGAAGSNYGLRVQAGLNASDYGLFVTDSTSTSGYFIVRGDGSAKAFNGFEVGGNLTVSGLTTSAGVSNSGALTFTAAAGQIAGSIAKNATYGLTYYGVTGSSNDNTMLNASGAVVLSNPAGTTNATLTGNLTVSGTGTINSGFTAGTNAGDNFLIKGGIQTIKEYGGGACYLDFGQFGVDTTTNGVLRTMSSGSRVTALTLSGTNATLAGNLTVSGTGTSSFAGSLTVSLSQNADTELRLTNTNAGASARAAFILTGQASSFGTYVNNTYVQNYTPAALDLQWWTSGTQHLTLKSGGNVLIGTTTDGGQKLQVSGGTKFSDATAEDQFNFYNTATTPTYSSLLRLRQVNTSADPASTYLIYADVQNGGSAGVKFTVNENGRLQLATHTTSAGGIGFGTDTSLYRIGTGWLALDSTGGDNPNLWFRESGSSKATVQSYLGDLYISTVTSGKSMYLRTGVNTTALTLDSSQNATFAGSVIPNSAPSNKWGIDFVSANTSAGSYVTIANDGVYVLASGSGMIFVWEDAGAGASQIMCYYGQTAILWQSGENLYSTTVDTANKVNVYYSSGTYKIQNKSGSSKNFFVPTIRLRNSV